MTRIPDAEEKPLLTVDEFVKLEVIDAGRSATHEMILRGELPSIRIGRRTYIVTAELRRMLGLDSTHKNTTGESTVALELVQESPAA